MLAVLRRLYRVALCGAATWLSLAAAVPSEAGEIGHYAPGLLNIRDYAMPPPGAYFALYNYFYTTDRLNDRHGKEISSVNIGPGPGVNISTNVDVDLYVTVPTFIWASPWTIAGARYGALISPSFANSSIGAALAVESGRGVNPSTSQFGVGDLFVQPVWLDWSLPPHWDFSLAYGFYAPIGQYDVETVTFPVIGPQRVESTDNIGMGFWTHQFQSAVAWYPFDIPSTAVTAAVTYEINSGKRDFDLVPGSRVSLNWGASQYLPITDDQTLLLELGPAGYSQWQVSDDSGSDAANGVRDQVHAVGLQLGLTFVPWNAALNVHYFYEFAAEDRFQGQSAGLNFAMKF